MLGIAFRPFFLLGAIFAVVSMLLWLVLLHSDGWQPGVTDVVAWHAHEMLFGFAGAAMAGFLLTAVATWTGRPPVSGIALGALVTAWIAGRVAVTAGHGWPYAAVAISDIAFPLLFVALVSREVISGGNRRNFGILVVVAGFALLDGVFHLGASGIWPGVERTALLLTAHALLVLITVIAGRIIPVFTGNWLRLHGDSRLPKPRAWLEIAIIPATILTGLSDSFGAPPVIIAVLSIGAAVLHGLRLAAWQGQATTAEPLVLILHVAYAWLPIGYLLLGLVAFGLPLPRSAALHALTMGAVGTMILAVASRVALGHTGRPLTASPLTVAAYVALNAGVLVRVLSPLLPGAYLPLIDVAAACWIVAFGLFLRVYWAILTRPRL